MNDKIKNVNNPGMARKSIPLRVKLAAALREILRLRAESESDVSITLEQAKDISADKILSMFEFDHVVAVADGGTDDYWNLDPQLVASHRQKTAKIDIPRIAKRKRIGKKWREFTRAMSEGKKPPRRISRWPKRKNRSRPAATGASRAIRTWRDRTRPKPPQ